MASIRRSTRGRQGPGEYHLWQLSRGTAHSSVRQAWAQGLSLAPLFTLSIRNVRLHIYADRSGAPGRIRTDTERILREPRDVDHGLYLRLCLQDGSHYALETQRSPSFHVTKHVTPTGRSPPAMPGAHQDPQTRSCCRVRPSTTRAARRARAHTEPLDGADRSSPERTTTPVDLPLTPMTTRSREYGESWGDVVQTSLRCVT